MMLVTAIVKPLAVADIRAGLDRIDAPGVTISEVSGVGRQRGHTEVFRGADYRIDFVPKVRVEVMAEDEFVEDVVATLTTAARTGKIGDGKVWVTAIEQVVRIRTGERGADAL